MDVPAVVAGVLESPLAVRALCVASFVIDRPRRLLEAPDTEELPSAGWSLSLAAKQVLDELVLALAVTATELPSADEGRRRRSEAAAALV